MRKLYTLKQCFELNGSKFPFTVLWHNRSSKIIVQRTFFEYTEGYEGPNTGMSCLDCYNQITWHSLSDNIIEFDPTTLIYKNDFDALISDTKEETSKE